MAKTITADDVLEQMFFTPEGEANPYPLFRVLHDMGPLHRWSRDGCWYVTGYDAVRDLLVNPRIGHDDERMFRRPGMTAEQVDAQRARMAEADREPGFSMISENPPVHTRLRRLVSRAFTTPRIEKLRAQLDGLVDDRLDEMAEAGDVDVMQALAFPLPVTVISELVGVPESERKLFRDLADVSAGVRPSATQEEVRLAEDTFAEMDEFFKTLVADRRADPQDDLLSALIAVQDEDDGRLSDQELRDTVVLLYFAGFITTTSLIGNGLLALLRHPSEMAKLWAEPSLAIPAVEEFLRYEGPIDMLQRDTLEATTVAGVEFGPDEHFIVHVAAANHDPTRFKDPDRLDITRDDSQAVSFGWGIHHCLGAPLARLEAQIAFSRMAQRFSGIDLLDPDPKRVVGIVRRVDALPVRVHSR
jgi:cytochrome P450